MVINGGSRGKWKRFAVHLANEKDNDGGVRLVEVRGLNARNIKEGFAQLQAMADMAGAGEKEFYYHANINPKEGEHLTREQWEKAEEKLDKSLNLDGQPGMTIQHTKEGRTHRHVIRLRVDLDTGKLISDSWNYARHEKTARELEREFALEPVKGALVERDGPRPERRPKNWEVQRGKRSGVEVEDVGKEVTALWNGCNNGAALRTAFAENGYTLCKGDRGANFCIVDAAGNEHSLSRRIESARARDVREKLKDIDQGSLPTVKEARAERRGDRERVKEAVGMGADKENIERAINAGRAADVAPQEGSGGDSGREREAYERTFAGRRSQAKEKGPDPEPPPSGGLANWQERQGQREKDLEPER